LAVYDYTQDANCVGAWLFTEGSGTTVDDSSPNSNTGTFSSDGHPAWSTDVPAAFVSGSVNFTPNDYINKTSFSSVTAPPITIVAWFKSDSSTSDQTLVTIGKNDTSDDWFRLLIRGSVSGDPVQIDINANSSYSSVDTTTGYTVGSWAHAAAVFTSTTSRTVYINAGSSATNTDTRVPSGVNSIGIGRLERSNPVEYMDGLITEVAIFSRVLSSTEINDIMDNGLKQVTSGGIRIIGNRFILNRGRIQ
jgi:hypothetical protein